MLSRLQRWVHRLVRWMIPSEFHSAPSSIVTSLAEPLADVAVRIERIESLLGFKIEGPLTALQLPAKRIADCGHETTSWFQAVKDGVTRCPECHDRMTRPRS